MFKKTMIGFLLFTILIAFTACGAAAQVQTTLTTPSTVQNNLGVGILQLEDSALAVTAEQAAALLPLWKAVKSLPSDTNTTALEIASLYEQIEETLTPEQVQAIAAMQWSQEALNAIKQQYGAQNVQAAAQASESGPQSGAAQPQGGGPGGEMMAGGMTDGMTVEMDAMASANEAQQSGSAVRPSGSSSVALNQMVADALVTLLQDRVS